jgi:glycyl-tRNA synthetase beta chain
MLYARKEGIDKEVARAIFEHRLPRRAGDSLPTGKLGLVAALLDRFDTLAGYFGIGMRVKGTSDPFGLRRTALAVLSLIEANDLDINLETALRSAIENYGPVVAAPDDSLEALLAFVSDRLQVMLREQGFPHDQVAAALERHRSHPMRARLCVMALQRTAIADRRMVSEQAKRIVRIITEPPCDIDSSRLTDVEHRLLEAALNGQTMVRRQVQANKFGEAMDYLVKFAPKVAMYFDQTLINDSDAPIRRNRHQLLREVTKLFCLVADFTKVEKEGTSVP